MTDILDDAQVAELLDCDPKTVQEQARAGKLPAVKFGRSWRYPREALLEFLNDLAKNFKHCSDQTAVTAENVIAAHVRPGVYLLMKGTEIVYVGQSMNVMGRLGDHARKGVIDFDSYTIIACDAKDLLQKERELIDKHQPKHNKTPYQGRLAKRWISSGY